MAGWADTAGNGERVAAGRSREFVARTETGAFRHEVCRPTAIGDRASNLLTVAVQLQVQSQGALRRPARNARVRRAGAAEVAADGIGSAGNGNMRAEALRRRR